MLTFLKVKDFAIIEELGVEFGEGFNVITGETGAGKSIIINALAALMNQKISFDAVRSNGRQAEITGHFFAEEGELLVKRMISPSGRSRGFLNGEPVLLGKLEETGSGLIDIYGQHELQTLLEKDSYTLIIDRLLGLQEQRVLLAGKVQDLRRARSDLQERRKEREGQGKEMNLLSYQVEEIERCGLHAGEEEEIKERLGLLKDAEKIRNCLAFMEEILYGDEGSAYSLIARASGQIRPFLNIPMMEGLGARMEALACEVNEAVGAVREAEHRLECDPDELAKLDDRLALISILKRKYGQSYEEIEAFLAAAKERVQYLSQLETDLDELEGREAVLRAEVQACADDLTSRRLKGLPGIEEKIVNELGFLSMEKTVFRIVAADKGYVDEEGQEDMEFMISTNPGEPLKPLRKTASGGELSRIMLAIKSVLGSKEEKTLIFDEIDAGIGGRVADVVGRRLQELARRNQILCITHLPQIAVYGDRHFLVEKVTEEAVTRTGVRTLSPRERIMEVARMLGGTTMTEKTIERAEEMFYHAQKSTH